MGVDVGFCVAMLIFYVASTRRIRRLCKGTCVAFKSMCAAGDRCAGCLLSRGLRLLIGQLVCGILSTELTFLGSTRVRRSVLSPIVRYDVSE